MSRWEASTAGDTPEAPDIQQLADKLWQAADKLRGQVDAAEYKHVVLGLLFLKYISDAFESRRDELRTELRSAGIPEARIQGDENNPGLLENPDEYTAERVFWVPPEARWSELQAKAVDPKIAQHIDDAILAVEASNEKLKGKLPRDYARRGINPTKLGELITEVIAQIGFKASGGARQARDTLGRVYEYFLGKFAAAEGKLGGEFYTPRSVVRVLASGSGRACQPAVFAGVT